MIEITNLDACLLDGKHIGSPAEAMTNLPDLRFEIFGKLVEFIDTINRSIDERESALTEREQEYNAAQSVIASRDAEIVRLNAQITKLTTPPPEDWPSLAKGWMGSAIGQKARNTASVDQTEMVVALILKDFSVLQMAYGHILKKLTEAGHAATKEEMGEISQLIVQCGFVKP